MKPVTLKLMESLDVRMNLEKEAKEYLMNLKRGYLGECLFCQRVGELGCEHILLRDLYFEPKYSGPIQIDCLLLIGNMVIIYEVKNYSGIWTYGEESYRMGELERLNPLIQLTRTKNNFKSLLREMGYSHINVDAVVVHIGNNFTLMGATMNRSVVLPTQLEDHLTKLDCYKYALSHHLRELAKQLPAHTMVAKPFGRMIPEYRFDYLRKGLRCGTCGRLITKRTIRSYTCKNCKSNGSISLAIMEATSEFKLLFPHETLTSRKLHDWCGGEMCLRTYKRFLIKSGLS